VLHGSTISPGLKGTRDALYEAVAAANSDLRLSVDLVGCSLGKDEGGEQDKLGQALASPEWRAATHSLLFNNAGVIGRTGANVGNLSFADYAEPISINAIAMGCIAGVYLSNTKHKASRWVVHTSSMAAKVAIATWAPYCASKAAAHAIHACIAAEQKDTRVLQYSPGPLVTDMTSGPHHCTHSEMLPFVIYHIRSNKHRFYFCRPRCLLQIHEQKARCRQRQIGGSNLLRVRVGSWPFWIEMSI
jgi:NAD(P)-dependent dehydrogenase (short-subunit alcohol dehydrogenase family)